MKDNMYEQTRKALINFENIKDCIQGLHEILKISLPHNNIYFKMGQDNIEALYNNFLDLMVNDIGVKEFMKKIKSAEVDINIPLDIHKF